MPHRISYMYINFQQNRVSRSVKKRTYKFICEKNRKMHKFATTNSNFEKKSILLDMHHHKTYMYINFQQNRVTYYVITVHTNVFAKNGKLHKFGTTNNLFFFKLVLSDMHHRKTYMYNKFQQN